MTTVYLIPSLLSENALSAIPAYVLDTIKNVDVFFVENERTTRRYFKQLWKEMVIDDYEWNVMDDSPMAGDTFKKCISENKNIGIVSEAGCPGIADPGQALVAIAQRMNITVRPLVGPNSILLALMASGMNGQQFQFNGYLPVDSQQRTSSIRELETLSARKKSTQIFIETPYRNNQMMEALIKNCKDSTRICVAVNITGNDEFIRTKTVVEWRKETPDLHKKTVIFLLYAGD